MSKGKLAELCCSCPMALIRCPAKTVNEFKKESCKNVHKVKVDGVIQGLYAPPDLLDDALESIRNDGHIIEMMK